MHNALKRSQHNIRSLEFGTSALYADKKLEGSTMHLVVPEAVGRCRIEAVPAQELGVWLRQGGAR